MPTIDADGLTIHALLRFADIPYSASPGSHTAPCDPPVIVLERTVGSSRASPETVDGLSGLVGLLTSDPSLPDPNAHLTPFMTAESTAFVTLVHARFVPARIYEFYVKQVNYDDIWHNVLSKTDSFPLNRLVPFLGRRGARQKFEAYGKSAPEAYFDAGIALSALATRLGERQRYFYGEKPSVLDAIVFGQLSSVLFAPLPDAHLRSMIATHANLLQFVMRIKADFFPVDANSGWGADLNAQEIAALRRAAANRLAREQRQDAARVEAEKKQKAREAAQAAAERGDFQETAEERRTRHNWYFIYGSAAVFVAHLLLGNEIELELGSD